MCAVVTVFEIFYYVLISMFMRGFYYLINSHKVKFQELANLWVIPRGKECGFKKQRERGENTPK